MSKLGTQIRTIRLLKGLNQTALAGRIGVTRTELVYIEQGRVLPSPEKLTAIEAALGISFSHPETQAAFAVLAGGDNGRA